MNNNQFLIVRRNNFILSKLKLGILVIIGLIGMTLFMAPYKTFAIEQVNKAKNDKYLTISTSNNTSASIPADNESYYYLVVAQYNSKEDSYGLDSFNVQRPAAFTPCLLQQIGNCNP